LTGHRDFAGHRRLSDDRLLRATASCPDDGMPLAPTGDAYSPYGSDDPGRHWRVAFRCPLHPDETLRIWSPELQPLLDEVLAGVDTSTLPIVGAGLQALEEGVPDRGPEPSV
jgi:hypothetical protein